MSLDREIEALLAVDPSPDFVARVRQRVTAEPAPATWWWSWRVASAGAALAAITLAATLWPADIAPTSAPGGPSTSATDAATADETVATAIRDTASAPTTERRIAQTVDRTIAPAVKARIAPTTNTGIAPPELVLSAEEQRAFALLIMAIEDDELPEVPAQEAAIAGPAWIHIEPVAITPIADAGAE
jgi:hypothetical protein